MHTWAESNSHWTVQVPALCSPRIQTMSTGASCGCSPLAAAVAAPSHGYGAVTTAAYSLLAQANKVSARLHGSSVATLQW